MRRQLLLALVLAVPLQAAAQPKPLAVPPGGATFPTGGNTLTITNTPGAVIQWQTFQIGAGSAGKFIQQPGSSAVLNRVVGQSSITGALQANPAVPAAPAGALPVAPHVYFVSPSGMAASQATDVQIRALRPASATAAAILPDGRVVFRATPP